MGKRIGGQAVLEGVMLRGNGQVATAVRQPSGEIAVDVSACLSLVERHAWLDVPVVRGAVGMYEALVIGLRTLSWSAQVCGEEDEQLTDWELALTLAASVAGAVLLFVLLPTWVASAASLGTNLGRHALEGASRLAVFLAYLAGITQIDGMKRILQYHGAEHKTINAYESGVELTVANVQRASRYHARCGTSFLLLVMLVSTVVYALTGWQTEWWQRLASRVALLPVIAGVSYEVIRYAGSHTNALARFVSVPGKLLQRLTTREPEDSMVEVALASLAAVNGDRREPA